MLGKRNPQEPLFYYFNMKGYATGEFVYHVFKEEVERSK